MENYTFRLKSGQDLFEAIQECAAEKNIEAGCVVSCVGSLTSALLRFAHHDTFTRMEVFFEIVSVTGTVSVYASHPPLSVSDAEGRTIGRRMDSGCKIYATAEIVILAFENEVYKCEFAEDSRYDELTVYKRQGRDYPPVHESFL